MVYQWESERMFEKQLALERKMLKERMEHLVMLETDREIEKDVFARFEHCMTLNLFIGGVNSNENLQHMIEQKSIFHELSEELVGYRYNIRDEEIFTYYNMNDFNFITLHTFNPYFGKETPVVYWKQAVKIPITHEFLSEFMHGIFIVLKDENCLAARMMYFKYKNYFSEDLWKNLLDNKIDRRVIRNVFRRFC